MFADLLTQKKDAIGQRWLESILATYRTDATDFLMAQKNRFANPVGQTFSVHTGAVVEGLLENADASEICAHLEEIVKIRAVQEFTPAEAVSFVFLLKDAIREETAEALAEPDAAEALRTLDIHIDQIALFAFDIYVKWREKVYNLRLNEIRAGYVQPGDDPQDGPRVRPARGGG